MDNAKYQRIRKQMIKDGTWIPLNKRTKRTVDERREYMRNYMRDYNAKYPEKNRENARNWYVANPEKKEQC